MNRHKVPANEHRTEIIVVNSRFITTISPVFSVAAAKDFIKKIKSEFADASHNVSAYIVGHGPSVISHCNDDGEPSGTAGRPALSVLQGSGLGDAVVVVTRYFGGTKLGRGGLVRAYGDAVRSLLRELPLAEKIQTHLIMISIPYNQYEQTKFLIRVHHGEIKEEDFTSVATITFRLPVEKFSELNDSIKELTQGKTQLHVVKSNETTIMRVK